MNALKHAQAEDMWIAVREIGDSIELQLRDNGLGFDPAAPGPEGHYGMAMMRERAQVGGGSFDAESTPGAGTTITVRFPTSLLQEVRREAEAATEEGARDTGARTAQAAESSDQDAGGSRQAVRA
jgi:signal transduction histidine kinase